MEEVRDFGLLVEFLDIYGDGILALDKSLKISYMNKRAKEILATINKDMKKEFWKGLFETTNIGETKEVFHSATEKWYELHLYKLENQEHVITIKDITEKKEYLNMLKKKNEEFESFIKAAFDEVYEYSPKLDKYKPIKTQRRSSLENTAEPCKLKKNVHPGDLIRVREDFKEAIEKEEMLDLELRYGEEGEDYGWIRSKLIPILDENENLEKWIKTVDDISLRKEYELNILKREEELRESRCRSKQLVAELREASRVKDKFISTIAHEMRNPLSTMIMGLTLLNQVDPGSKVDLDTRDIIKRQAGQLAGIVDDLIHSNKLSRNKLRLVKREVELNQLIRETLKDYRPCFDDLQISLLGEFPPDDININLDPIRIKQVIGNLLSNALKFTDKEGQVKVRVFREDKMGDVTIEVEDTGVGIDRSQLKDMFEEFIQLNNTRSGTKGLGLGLSIVRGIVDLHGGSIEAESEGLGKGSKFIIRLPI